MEDKKLSKRKYKIRSKKQKHSRKRTQKKNKRSLKIKNTNRRTRRRNTRRNTRRNIHGGRNPFLKRERKKVEKIKKEEALLKKRQEKRLGWQNPPDSSQDSWKDLMVMLEKQWEKKRRMDEEQNALVKGINRMGEEQKRIGNLIVSNISSENDSENDSELSGLSVVSGNTEKELEEMIQGEISNNSDNSENSESLSGFSVSNNETPMSPTEKRMLEELDVPWWDRGITPPPPPPPRTYEKMQIGETLYNYIPGTGQLFPTKEHYWSLDAKEEEPTY